MELHSLQSVTLSKIPRRGFAEKLFLCGQAIKLLPCNSIKRYPDTRKLKFLDFRAQASGTTKLSSVAPETNSKDVNLKDGNLVFVAGATGRVGSRTVRELLKSGFQVRAGVRSIQRAEPLVKSVKQMKLDNVADGGTSSIERLEIVECDLEKSNIVPALGNASTVICCIGASEKEVFDITGPYRIDYQATKNLIDAATTAQVKHFILLTSLGTNRIGFPAAILNLFWGVLCWKRRAEEALLASGLPYTIVRPGGMERPTDTYKETHNITLSQEDTLFGGQVSNLQVAELMAFMAKNPSLSYYKVVEVIAETTTPLTPTGDLLTRIPSKQEIYPAKEPGDMNQPAVSAGIIPEISSTSMEKESTLAMSIEAKPLSPYTAYADLKPPSSPTPNPPSGRKDGSNIVDKVSVPAEASKATEAVDTNLAKVEVQKASPLSPYTAYEDLKPPTSPTPTQSRPKPSTTTEVELQLNVPTNGPPSVVENDRSQNLTSRNSPYVVYEDFKPPTSPTPTPSGPKASQLPGGNNVPMNDATNVVEKDTLGDLASRHSPYLAYDDLKPPTSPSPNAPMGSQNKKVQPLVAEKPENITC